MKPLLRVRMTLDELTILDGRQTKKLQRQLTAKKQRGSQRKNHWKLQKTRQEEGENRAREDTQLATEYASFYFFEFELSW